MTEDDIIYWQDHLEAVMNQLPPDKFPKCGYDGCKGVVTVTKEGRKTRLECQTCRRFIEGRFSEEEYNL